MSRWKSDNILRDKIRNKCIHNKNDVTPIENKI